MFNDKPLTAEQLGWADVVIVMEDKQREEIAKRFPEQYLDLLSILDQNNFLTFQLVTT